MTHPVILSHLSHFLQPYLVFQNLMSNIIFPASPGSPLRISFYSHKPKRGILARYLSSHISGFLSMTEWCSVFITAANFTSIQNCPVQVQQVLNVRWKLAVLYEQLSQSQVIVFVWKRHNKQVKAREKWCSYLPLFVKYFILLAITAVLSLASKNENMLVSSQSSTTASKGNKNDMTHFQAVNHN